MLLEEVILEVEKQTENLDVVTESDRLRLNFDILIYIQPLTSTM